MEVQVRQDEADRAAEVLRVALSDEVEPADEQPQTVPSPDPDGEPIPLQIVARFASIRPLREAALLLESARIRSVPPKLVAREGAAGVGDRFHLRVAVDDVERANEVLADLDEDTDDDEHRCPKCGSWRVYPVGQFMPLVRWILRMGDKPVAEMDCLECKHRGPKDAFQQSS